MHFLAGASEGHKQNPIVLIIVGNYPLSFYGTSAGNICSSGAVNVYPLQKDPPCPLEAFASVSSYHRL